MLSTKELEDFALAFYGLSREAVGMDPAGHAYSMPVMPGASGYDATGKLHRLRLIPYSYPITIATLAQGATITTQVQIAANADFIFTEPFYRANIGAAQNVSTKTAAFIRALLTDTGSNEQFTNAAIDLETFCSNDAKLNPLRYPRMIQGRSSVNCQFTSYAPTNETYAFDFVMRGALCYSY